jgi:transposase-like protein
LEVAPSHPLPTAVQLTMPLPELMDDLRAFLFGKINNTIVHAIEQFLHACAYTIAGEKHQGLATESQVYWHATQPGSVYLKDTKVKVKRPRLRSRVDQREVAIPCYQELRERGDLGDHLREVVLQGISTRRYQDVLPGMMEAAGLSRSSVSRHLQESTARSLEELSQRRFDQLDIVAIFVDGLVFGSYHVISAVGVAADGSKHVLGLREGGSENHEVVVGLLRDIVQRGVPAEKKRLFVIDGGKALRSAISEIFGEQPVQRCRLHKERNVLRHLPDSLHDEVKNEMRLAWELPAEQGMVKLEQLARRLEKQHAGATASLREGMAEMFTVNRLAVPKSLWRSLTSTNIIDSTFNGPRRRTRNVTHWQSSDMVLRWAAASLLEREARYHRLPGHRQLWRLVEILKNLGKPSPTKSDRCKPS